MDWPGEAWLLQAAHGHGSVVGHGLEIESLAQDVAQADIGVIAEVRGAPAGRAGAMSGVLFQQGDDALDGA